MHRLALLCLTLPLFAQTLPLKTDRKLTFQTDEATWLALDVNPTDKCIVFELLGDLYSLPFSGGEAKLLIGGLGMETQPVFSPDGESIAFLSDRDGAENLWISDSTGATLKQITKDSTATFVSPAWSPDGQFLAVSRITPQSRTAEIWMYHRDGGAGIQVTKAAEREGTPNADRLSSLGARFSPDGKYLYYSRRKGLFSYNVTLPLWQLIRRDRVTGEEDVVTEAPTGALRPLLSPDGNTLVYATRYETETALRLRDLKSGAERWLKYPIQHDDQEAMATRDTYPNYAFTPDGKDVVLTFGGKIQRVSVFTGEHQTIPFTAQVNQEVGPLLDVQNRIPQGPIKARLIQNPQPAPDNKSIVFSALGGLYIAELGAAPKRLLAADKLFAPAYSPDGQWIAYTNWTNRGGHIWKVRANGQGAPQQLTTVPSYYLQPTWSPDGQKIVALRSSIQSQIQAEFASALYDVIWIPAAGGDAQLITPARGAKRPHFVTAEPDRVYLYSSKGLQSVRLDGTDLRSIMKINGTQRGIEPNPATDARLSPDGRTVAALSSHQLYTFPRPEPGATGLTIDLTKPQVPVKKVTTIGADSFAFTADSKTLVWSAGPSYFRQPLGSTDKPQEFPFSIEVPRSTPTGSILLRNAKLITMKGAEIVENADLLITNNKIAALGKRGSFPVPTGTKIQDVTGHTIMPGIIDVHAHWRVQRDVIEEQSWSFLANLAYGVTAGRDPQTMTYDMFAYQDTIDQGGMLGPRAFSTGPGVFADTDFKSYEETRDALSRYSKYYGTHMLKSYMVGNRKQRQWVVQASKELGIMPTTEGGLDLKLNITHALDGFSGNEHALPILPLYKDVVELFSKTGITYTPTLLVAYGGPWAENYFYETTDVYGDTKLKRFIPQNVLYLKASRRNAWFSEEEHVFKRLAQSAKKVVDSGGRVTIGGHGQLQGIQCHWEMWALQSGGMTNWEVLRAATIHGAEALGYAQDIGSLEPGKLADLLVLRKDPLTDIRNTNTIRYVMKNGDLFDADSMDQLWPTAKKLGDQWWWNQQPKR
jgi:Tol biopolymer transport system component